MATKNIFANIGADDSDDDLIEKKPLNKTQKKKEERKVNRILQLSMSDLIND